jgi:gamma-glutamyl-gamma-aminobutyrate hydrolase PuuD
MGKRVALTFRFDDKAVPYADALRAVGLEPVLCKPGIRAASFDGFDGLLLSGGTDLNPRLYDAEREAETGDPDDERDRMESDLLDKTIQTNTPVLAICRGMQLFNVRHGGTLVQHLEGHQVRSVDPSDPVHLALQEPGSRLAEILGTEPVEVNSRHHQAVGRVGLGLVVTSRATDGVIEGLERQDQRFAVAVQWHPEDQVRRYPVQLRLFEAFAAAL